VATVKTRVNRLCARWSKISSPKKGEKHTKNLLSKTNEKEKTPDLTKRDNPNVLARGPFVRVLTVMYGAFGRLGQSGVRLLYFSVGVACFTFCQEDRLDALRVCTKVCRTKGED